MFLVDTHTHLFLDQFDEDRENMLERAVSEGIRHFFLPNIDVSTIGRVWEMAGQRKECYPMMGLHPGSVKEDYQDQLERIEREVREKDVYAVGETGLDFYWSSTYKSAQIDSFRQQIRWAKELDLPVIIHCRNSYNEIYRVLKEGQDSRLKGIFHCFTGSVEEGKKILDLGLYLGIGGILTFKNAGLDKTVKELPLDGIVLETDSPFLAPVPRRGKRNESAFMIYTARKLSGIKERSLEEITSITTDNAQNVFNVDFRAIKQSKKD